MKLSRVFAAIVPALVICVGLAAGTHAQRAPSAAPAGDPAQTEPLAAPTSNLDVVQTGGDSAPSAIGSISVCAPAARLSVNPAAPAATIPVIASLREILSI